jgi:hypothetical protein
MSLEIENQNSDSEHRSQVRKKMKKRFDGLHKYMCFLYENTDGYIEIKAIRDSSMGEVKTFYISKIEDMPLRELISLNNDGYNIYSGVGTRKSETGGKNSVSEVSALWVCKLPL